MTTFDETAACLAIINAVEEQITRMGLDESLGVNLLVESGLALAAWYAKRVGAQEVTAYESYIQIVMEQIQHRSGGSIQTHLIREDVKPNRTFDA